MQKTFVLLAALLVAGLGFVGCKSSGDSGSGGACGARSSSGCNSDCSGDASSDIADMMIKMYLDRQQKASPFVSMHEFVSVGRYWETTSTYGETKT